MAYGARLGVQGARCSLWARGGGSCPSASLQGQGAGLGLGLGQSQAAGGPCQVSPAAGSAELRAENWLRVRQGWGGGEDTALEAPGQRCLLWAFQLPLLLLLSDSVVSDSW